MSEIDPVRQALKAASAEIVGAAGGAAGDQAELFDLPVLDPTGEIEQARARGLKGGRPRGAQNIATRELRDWLLKRGVLPQQALMQWFMLGPEGLAKALGCTKAEAFDRWKDLGDKLGRYFMAPMTPVDDQGKPVPSFQVIIGGAAGITGADGAMLPPWEYLQQQDQGLIEEAPSAPKTEEG